MLKLNIKDLSDRILTISIDALDTVADLHDLIVFEWALPRAKYRLVFKWERLELTHSLSQTLIKDQDTIRILYRPWIMGQVEEDKVAHAKLFWERIGKHNTSLVEGKTRDVVFYMGQSWNQTDHKDKTKIIIVFDDEIDGDWKSVFKEVALMIEEATPGIEIKWYESWGIKCSEGKDIFEVFFLHLIS